MSVLLAEGDFLDRLIEMDEINGDFPQTDVALVIGNDVTIQRPAPTRRVPSMACWTWIKLTP
jgi:NAD(P) transhydrogenase subunit beta